MKQANKEVYGELAQTFAQIINNTKLAVKRRKRRKGKLNMSSRTLSFISIIALRDTTLRKECGENINKLVKRYK
jgi:hypothetical protein